MASAEANHIWVLVGSSNDPSNILGLYFLKSLKCLAFANSWSRTFCGSTLGHEQGLARVGCSLHSKLFFKLGSTELTLKFSGSAAGLVGDSFLSLGGSVERGFRSRGITEYQCALRIRASFGSTRLIRASFGSTRLICASFGSTRLIRASFGSTRLICASFGSTRLICAFYGTTRLLCRGAARGRLTRGRKDA
ncbi:hypothetical protein E6C27_scaffold230G001100 [Cucumis melo var. makuwa]|uniref:NAC-alpha domain-containing protein 1 n=1 Tax=Cucumis melo var. makuwa TaxID=1194695 RepID=A0A5A7TVN1_CUCMM|nr:hypothetical protein E6C27_scaffold230G001100 [Cucumis melo var. makuwa]